MGFLGVLADILRHPHSALAHLEERRRRLGGWGLRPATAPGASGWRCCGWKRSVIRCCWFPRAGLHLCFPCLAGWALGNGGKRCFGVSSARGSPLLTHPLPGLWSGGPPRSGRWDAVGTEPVWKRRSTSSTASASCFMLPARLSLSGQPVHSHGFHERLKPMAPKLKRPAQASDLSSRWSVYPAAAQPLPGSPTDSSKSASPKQNSCSWSSPLPGAPLCSLASCLGLAPDTFPSQASQASPLCNWVWMCQE